MDLFAHFLEVSEDFVGGDLGFGLGLGGGDLGVSRTKS